MAFGQAAGPPAGGRKMAELLNLLQDAGYAGYRDARGPMGFTQRQGNGKFTDDEADEFIARLQDEAEAQRTGQAATAGEPPAAAPTPTSAPAKGSYTKALRKVPDDQLAAELERRGWTVESP
ncbi:MAG: hypothetical protein GY745_01865 [Actinomycetia bacterium]|nr:hypothetical protein [Actinomycetes bacterium]MCP4083795.1 hypothetical protein [Actinomycetes bacterium]